MNNHQATSFLAPIVYASEHERGYLKLVQQNKYIFTQDLPLNNYYDATMVTMIAHLNYSKYLRKSSQDGLSIYWNSLLLFSKKSQ